MGQPFLDGLRVVIAGGRWLPAIVNGGLIFAMTIPAIAKKVSKGESRLPSKEYMEKCQTN